MNTPGEILVLKPSSLGDVVHTLPAVALVKRRWPEARLRWLINPEWAPLLDGNPHVDEVVIFPRGQFRGIAGLMKIPAWASQMGVRKADLVLDFQGLLRSALIAKLCRAERGRIVGLSDAREGSRLFYDQTADVGGIVFLGAMLADVPHTRPISIFVSSDNPQVRAELQIERSTYEGPVGILSVLAIAAEEVGIPTLSIWASVPHYVHNAPSPKAMLALIDKLEEIIDVVIPRGELVSEAEEWQSGIDTLAAEDDEMAAYIGQLEQARDTVDSPEASGEAIAQEFEKYLRKRGDGRDSRGEGRQGPDGPRQP